MKTDVFALRHIGPRNEHFNEMLKVVGVGSIDELIVETVPRQIVPTFELLNLIMNLTLNNTWWWYSRKQNS